MLLLTPDRFPYWTYNALDCSITSEVFRALSKTPGGFAYDMSRAMQGPALQMMLRGVRIDIAARALETERLEQEYNHTIAVFNRICREAFDEDINPRSAVALRRLFIEHLGLEPVHIYDRGKREYRESLNREALLKLAEIPVARPFTTLVFHLRSLKKLLNVYTQGIDPDGRMRCGYQVAGTITGRWSSNESAFGTGGNLQNVTDRARRMFIPDPGYVMVQMDLSQAESRGTAAISGDKAYQQACDSGDLHTMVARLCFPTLPWGSKPDREIADQVYLDYGGVKFTYRDMAKRAGHGSNYGATPATVAKTLQIPISVAEDFQRAYFSAFPDIRRWHRRVQAQLALNRTIETPLGRRCQFLGRLTDSETIKSAIAYGPQSLVADILNLGLFKVWQKFDLFGSGDVQLLLQVHDAIVLQVRETHLDMIGAIRDTLVTPVQVGDYTLVIPADVSIGQNWGKRTEENLRGLDKWKG